MKFSEYKYERIDLEKIKNELARATEIVKNSNNFKEVEKVISEVNQLKADYSTMESLCYIRYTVNTFDEFYTKEQDFFDEFGPIVSGYLNEYNKALVASPILDKLVERYGKKIFDEIKLELTTFSEEIIPELQEENRLVSSYQKLIASAKIEFDGKVLNLSQLAPYTESSDRNIRKEVELKVGDFTKEHEEEFDEIYDKLVKVRDKMAKKLGFPNYIELGYNRLGRIDYNSEMVSGYRKQIYEELVPLVNTLYEAQRIRLGLDKLMNYDLSYEFKSGNPKPIGDTHELVEKAKKMYSEMSKETKEFFDFMTERELMDLEAKAGKTSGGYCTYIPNYASPFIFSNFNGTPHDVDVLTHEFGHALQGYLSRNIVPSEYRSPTLESCEIHSMSMEFFAWPWMNLFFGADEDKYRYYHLSDAICFLPYGITIDEFQHWVYKHPTATHEERCAAFKEIESRYLPHKKYPEEMEVSRHGGLWMKQSHIFGVPFYYIDYTLAQVCAFQFLVEMTRNREKAWKKYIKLCKMGGKYPFVHLLQKAHLRNPFEDGNVAKVIRPLRKILKGFDTSKFE